MGLLLISRWALAHGFLARVPQCILFPLPSEGEGQGDGARESHSSPLSSPRLNYQSVPLAVSTLKRSMPKLSQHEHYHV